MVTSVTSTAPTQPSASIQSSKPTPSKPPSVAATTDSTELSSLAQDELAALQEATELPPQTAQEAASGDPQAQRLLAKETAALAAEK